MTGLMIIGIFFLVILIEESFHVWDSQGKAKSVCIDFNMRINDTVQSGSMIAHTTLDNSKWENVEQITTWRQHSEKIAEIITGCLNIILGFLLGLIIATIIHENR